MNEALSKYILAFDEINALILTSFSQSDSRNVRKRIRQVCDDLLSLLILAYTQGAEAAAGMLDPDLTPDTDKMYEAIYAVIDGRNFETRAAEYVLTGDLSGLQRLSESEYHRVFNTAMADSAENYAAESGFAIEKTWHTLLDDKVRETHNYLEGRTAALSEEYYTFDGDHGRFPGDFTKAENNVNCRCYLTYRAIV